MLNLDKTIEINEEIALAPNLMGYFSTDDLVSIANYVSTGFDMDKNSRYKWEKRTDAAMNLALQIVKEKNFPWPGSSNIAFPLVTMAAIQFHAEAYPAILPSPDVVNCRVTKEDPTGDLTKRADRVSSHMSYQILEEDEDWEEQHDRLLLSVPIVGCAFKKTYWDGQRNDSDLVLAHDFVLDYFAKSVETCARKTHIYTLYRNEIVSNVRRGLFADILEEPWYVSNAQTMADRHTSEEDKRKGQTAPQTNYDTPFTFLEQHVGLDLDGDGYSEPYIATIEYGSRKLVRLTARWEREEDVERTEDGEIISIRATEYFTKYPFIPSPDGGIYDLGFGVLLGPLNESTNSLLNQLVDAGTMSNTAGGFLGRGAKIRGGSYTFAPLEWKRVDSTGDDLRKNIVPLEVREPSMVLFQLLSLLINYTERVAGTTETRVGENPGQNTPATNMQIMVEQGMKVYSAIYKRLWRSMKQEFKKWYLLNAVHLPNKVLYGAKGNEARREDYLGDPSDIVPAADPNVTSRALKIQQAIMVRQAAHESPGYNRDLVERRYLKAFNVDGIDVIFTGTENLPPPPPDVKLQIAMLNHQKDMAQLQLEKVKFISDLQLEIQKNQAVVTELMARAAHEVAKADGVATGHQIAAFEAAIGAVKTHNELLNRQVETLMKGVSNESKQTESDGRAVQGLAAASGNGGGTAITEGAGAGA